jgi:hypothetical protein
MKLCEAAMVVLLVLSGTCVSARAGGGAVSWPTMLDAVRADAGMAADRDKLIASARRIAKKPIARRVYRYEDIGKFRTSLDGRARAMEGCPCQSWFGLAMSDCSTAGAISQDLPLLAVAYRWTADETLRARIAAQLEETSSRCCTPRTPWPWPATCGA